MWRSDLLRYLCYPSYSAKCVERRLSELSGLGVVGATKLLGKGHSSVVLEVTLVDGTRAALKVLRTDSKRVELLRECDLTRRAYPLSPRVIECGKDYILMEVVGGVPAAEAISETERALPLVLKVISAGRGLDVLGIDHAELSRAHKHVVVTPDGRIKILDYESATTSERPRNVCRLASWLLYRVMRVGIKADEVFRLLRVYKRASEEERRGVFPKLLTQLSLTISHVLQERLRCGSSGCYQVEYIGPIEFSGG